MGFPCYSREVSPEIFYYRSPRSEMHNQKMIYKIFTPWLIQRVKIFFLACNFKSNFLSYDIALRKKIEKFINAHNLNSWKWIKLNLPK